MGKITRPRSLWIFTGSSEAPQDSRWAPREGLAGGDVAPNAAGAVLESSVEDFGSSSSSKLSLSSVSSPSPSILIKN